MPVDFREALRRQLRFLSASCGAFDSGFPDEAIRIAVVIRVLVHNTRKSTALLHHLGQPNFRLLSTVPPIFSHGKNGPGPSMFNGMGQFSLGEVSSYHPKLGNTAYKELLSIDDWWTQVVFGLDPQTRLTRLDIVLTAADKDGGAHVDKQLTPEYERLVESEDLGVWGLADGSSIPISGHHYVGLRQMGFEILNSQEILAAV